MPTRRRFLSIGGLVITSTVSGCSMIRGDSKPVDVLFQNDDFEEWQVRVTVEDTTGEEVFRIEKIIPADSGEDLGEVLVEDAFTGNSGDQFTVQAWLEGEPAGTFDYEITCPDDNRFSLLVEHTPYEPDDGEPIDYVADRCGT